VRLGYPTAGLGKSKDCKIADLSLRRTLGRVTGSEVQGDEVVLLWDFEIF
jgi:hypothetical protein